MMCKISLTHPKSPVFPVPNFSTKRGVIPLRNSRIPVGPGRARNPVRIRAVHSAAETQQQSLYELLGIAGTVGSVDDIKKAYKQMARKYHPDVAPPDRLDEHTQRFILVKKAYDTLSNPQKRALYDRGLLKTYDNDNLEEKGEWKVRWEAQLSELKKRSMSSSRSGTSWAARMQRARR